MTRKTFFTAITSMGFLKAASIDKTLKQVGGSSHPAERFEGFINSEMTSQTRTRVNLKLLGPIVSESVLGFVYPPPFREEYRIITSIRGTMDPVTIQISTAGIIVYKGIWSQVEIAGEFEYTTLPQ